MMMEDMRLNDNWIKSTIMQPEAVFLSRRNLLAFKIRGVPNFNKLFGGFNTAMILAIY
jgi:hypothetical protein